MPRLKVETLTDESKHYTREYFMSKAEAIVRRLEIERKTKAQKAQNSGYVPSQWDGMTKINRLLKMGHLGLEGAQAESHYKREERLKKKLQSNEIHVKLIKRV